MKKFQQNIANQRDRLQTEVSVLNQQASSLRFGIRQLNGISHNGKRNIYDVYGYPVSLAGTEGFRLMFDMSKRMGMANRLTHGMAKSCWREGFEIKESNEDDAEPIEKDFLTDLNKQGLAMPLSSGLSSHNPFLSLWNVVTLIFVFATVFIPPPPKEGWLSKRAI